MTDQASTRRAVLITGSSTGIGRATALHLAGKGVRVLAGVRKPADGERLVDEGGECIVPILVDVADSDSIEQASAQLDERLDGHPLVGLVNNAGIAVGGPQEFLPLSKWRQQFDVNVFGLVELTQRMLPHLVPNRGRVVNVSSIGGRVATPMMGAYGASKFAVGALTDALRMELAPQGLWAACIEPGMVKTEIWKKGKEQLAEYDQMLPPDARARYEPLTRAIAKFGAMGPKRGVEPIAVARAIEHALFASRPKTRYPVGPDARVLVFLRWLLPDRALEWVLRTMM